MKEYEIVCDVLVRVVRFFFIVCVINLWMVFVMYDSSLISVV